MGEERRREGCWGMEGGGGYRVGEERGIGWRERERREDLGGGRELENGKKREEGGAREMGMEWEGGGRKGYGG